MLVSVKDNLFMVLFANFIASNKYLDLEKQFKNIHQIELSWELIQEK